jgi:lysophospholipase L1-like esterase
VPRNVGIQSELGSQVYGTNESLMMIHNREYATLSQSGVQPTLFPVNPKPAARPRLTTVLDSASAYFAVLGFSIVGLITVAALLELASWAIWSVYPSGKKAALRSQAASPVYAGADWAREFWQEETRRQQMHQTYVPFRLFSVVPWHSKYINNDQGLHGVWRRTFNPANCGSKQKVNVWTFGGSTMYGTAVPDWATLPSYLSRDLNAAPGNCVIVSNFGVEGYVSDQELMVLTEQLKAGGRPDVVVFYDGVNDSSLAFAQPGAPVPHFSIWRIKARIEGSLSGRLDFLQDSYAVRLTGRLLSHLRRSPSFAARISAAQPNIALVLDNYEGNLQLARALADAYKFRLYCFWQPLLTYGHKPLVPFEQQMLARDFTPDSESGAWFLTMNRVYQEVEHRASADKSFVYLGALFDSTKEPLYVDEAHLGPRGNEIVAQAIADHIQAHAEDQVHAER